MAEGTAERKRGRLARRKCVITRLGACEARRNEDCMLAGGEQSAKKREAGVSIVSSNYMQSLLTLPSTHPNPL